MIVWERSCEHIIQNIGWSFNHTARFNGLGPVVATVTRDEVRVYGKTIYKHSESDYAKLEAVAEMVLHGET